MIGFFMNISKVVLLLAICSNVTMVAMITIGDNGLKKATYDHFLPEGYREIRLVSKSWAQCNNEPKHLYDSYSKDGKISSTCAFLVCVHKDEIFDVEMFLRHTQASTLLRKCCDYDITIFNMFPLVSACKNDNKEMIDLFISYGLNKDMLLYHKELMSNASSFIDYDLCLLACNGDKEGTKKKFENIVTEGNIIGENTIDFIITSVIQNYDLELFKILLQFESCEKYIKKAGRNDLLLDLIILGYDAKNFNNDADFAKLTPTIAQLKKIKEFLDSGCFKISFDLAKNFRMLYFLKVEAVEHSQQS
jgi:hypothetical protein